MWISIVTMALIFILIGFFSNEILRTVLKEIQLIRKDEQKNRLSSKN